MPKFIDLTGLQFGRLQVICQAAHRPSGRICWLCQCQCGAEVTVQSGHLRSGHTISCGCFRKETTSKTAYRHGMSGSSTFRAWAAMLDRTRRKKRNDYKHYGGRGISVCKRWLKFENFLEDMGERPPGMTLGRRDNDRGYEPGNVRWETHQEQMNNTRRNHTITYEGETRTVAEWARHIGIRVGTLHDRLLRGWSVREALSCPLLPVGAKRVKK